MAAPLLTPQRAPTPQYGADHAEAFPHLLFAVINRLSGERSAADAVYKTFCSTFGAHRVFELTAEVFRNPLLLRTPLRAAKERHDLQMLTAPPEGRRRPTVLVAGGDGTVAFVMSAVQAEFYELPNHDSLPGSQAVAGSQDERASNDVISPARHSVNTGGGAGLIFSDREDGTPVHQQASDVMSGANDPSLPAIAVFPMGTGNDLSYTLGFGLGFTENHLCCACVCCPQDIVSILERTLNSPMVPFDRWEADVFVVTWPPAADGIGDTLYTRVRFNNYFSFGMDADIARRFDEGRRDFPTLHRLRTMNKLWYGVHGLTATPFAPTFTNGNVAISIDGQATPLSKASQGCKAVIITNVAGYSGGVDLWKVDKPATQKLPREVLLGRRVEVRDVALVPSSVGDGLLEVQTLGGLVHMTVLRSGAIGADRVGQGAAVEVLVTPPSDGSSTTVRMQADGEPLGEIRAPFRLKIARCATLHIHASVDSIACRRADSSQIVY